MNVVLYYLHEFIAINVLINKKVLRGRKRHTARRIASARSAALSSDGEGGISQSSLDGGYPPLVLTRGYPHPVWTWITSVQFQWGVP